MAEDIILNLDASGEGTIAVLDQIDASLSLLSDSIAAVAESAADFSALDAAMAEISAMTEEGAASFGILDDATLALIDSIPVAADEIDVLAAGLGTMGMAADTAAGSADVAATSMDAMGAAAEESGGMMEGLQAAMGPLMMVGMVAGMVGGKLVSMGMSGQKGEALLRGMAGASQSDINALQADAMKLGVGMDEASAGFYQVASAGYSGSAAITVFDAATRLAEGGQASASDTMSSLTAIMHDYNASSDQATHYTDLMAEAVLRGKQSMSDFASNIGPLASAGENVGLSFQQVAAAEATMTQINPHVAQDAQELASLFKSLSPTMGTVVTSAKKLGIAFDEQKYSGMDLLGKLQYLSDISGGTSTAAFVKLTGGVRGSTAAIDLLKGGAASFKGNLDAMGHSAGATANAFNQYEDTVPAHLNKAGAAISVFATRLMDSLGPKLNVVIDRVSSSIGTMANFLVSHGDVMNAVLAALGVVIGVILVGAMVSFVAASWPVILVVLAIAAAVAGIVMAFQHWGQIMGAVNQALQIPALHAVVQLLQATGAYIEGLFLPVWHQLVAMWTGELLPALSRMWAAIQPIITVLKVLGAIIGVEILIMLGTFIGMISGLIKALAAFFSGIITFIGGAVKFFQGFVEIIGGIVGLIVDLVTGHFDKLGADLTGIWQGIGDMFSGIWQMIQGAFQASIGVILAYISGFISGIVGYFQGLWSDLVGHSIVPDMINGIVSWFEQLPGRAMSAISSMGSQISGFFGNLASQALGWGADLVGNLASGITGAIGQVTSAIGNITGAIASHLHFTKPDAGELADADTWMPHMGDLLVEGITAQIAKIKQATGGITGAIAAIGSPQVTGPQMPALGGIATAAQAGGFGSNSTQTTALLQQILTVLQQQQEHSGNNSGNTSVAMNNTIHAPGINNAQQLYNLLQSLGGFGYQDLQRGAYSL